MKREYITKKEIEEEAKNIIKTMASISPSMRVYYDVFMRTPEKYLWSERVEITEKVNQLLKKVIK